MNSIFLLILTFLSFSAVKCEKGKLEICIPFSQKKDENTDNTHGTNIPAEALFREAFREMIGSVLPSALQDDKEVTIELNNDVIRGNVSVKNIGILNEELNISICDNIPIANIPTKVILREIVVHADEYNINGTVADIFYIYGKGELKITIKDLTIGVKDFGLGWLCFTLNIDVKLGGWEVKLENLMDDEVLEPTFNDIIGDMGPDIVDFLWPLAYEKLAPILQKIIDKYINHRNYLGDVDPAILKNINLNKLGEDDCTTYRIPIKK